MDYNYLANLLFKDINEAPKYYENLYPERNLKEGAKVTRIAPSPTGFMHLGNLFGAITDERLAHQSGGIFYLRIEDTDEKRAVEGGVKKIIDVFNKFGLKFDEGATEDGDSGKYGPYRQREREKIYKTYAKSLIERGLAYPCFCTEEDLANMRKQQENDKDNFGYYGKYAKYRDADIDQIKAKLDEEIPYVIRFKSMGNSEKKFKFTDLIKGTIEMPENDQDIVLLKSDGIPTYHFAHVIDDHLMRTSIVVRGEEWLSTLPIHLQLFDTLGFKRPKYAHTAQLMKMEGTSKRKLSKRKDPELALDYYHGKGYPIEAVIEYIMTLLNSNFEEWRLKNPKESIEKFNFTTKKMSVSGSLFDIDKLKDISKNRIANLDTETVYNSIICFAKEYDSELYDLLTRNPEYAKKIFSIGRGGKKPRKDIAIWSEVRDYINFFYDELFKPDYDFPDNVAKQDILKILIKYQDIYDDNDNMDTWFEKICSLSKEIGFAESTKLHRENPDKFKNDPGDTSMVLRVAVTGKQNSPDMYTVMNILGKQRIIERLKKAYNYIS